jgi:hypothetical protein
MDLPISQFEAEELLKTCAEPRVTEQSINKKIAAIDYLYHSTTTICVITMENGFKFIGTSTPAASANYRMELGQKYAFDNAFKQIWSHEGYLLRENLSKSERFENV